MDKREAIGIRDPSFELTTVGDLVKRGVLERPIDGNHGEIHPKSAEFVTEGVPFVMASDLKNGCVDYDGCAFITERQAEGLRKGFAKNGDVLLTHKATIGETAIVNYNKHPYIMLTPQVTYYRVKDRAVLSNRYLKAYFDSSLFQQTLQMLAGSGSTRAYLGITEQHRLPIILPPPDKQKKIAAILATLDDLITNNQRRIALLESAAEEIYREWFVRMRFAQHATLKGDELMPPGWSRQPIGELAVLIKRGISPDYAEQSEHQVINQKCIRGGRVSMAEARPHASVVPDDKLLRFGDVLINSTGVGTLGRAAVFDIEADGVTCDSHVTILRPKDVALSGEFLAYTIQLLQPYFESMASGSTGQAELSRELISRTKVPVPTSDLLKRFSDAAAPIRRQRRLLLDQNEKLSATKDQLLPRLISGKLCVDALDIQFPPSMQQPSAEAAQPAAMSS